MAFKKRRGS